MRVKSQRAGGQVVCLDEGLLEKTQVLWKMAQVRLHSDSPADAPRGMPPLSSSGGRPEWGKDRARAL